MVNTVCKLGVTMMLLLSLILITDKVEAYSDEELMNCVNILQDAELGIELDVLYNSCADLLTTGETFIPDFRDRGLIIIWATVGEPVHIPITFGDYF